MLNPQHNTFTIHKRVSGRDASPRHMKEIAEEKVSVARLLNLGVVR